MTSDLEQASDDIVIAAIADGRADAISTLFHRRKADVYRFAMHMTGLPAVAEDVTQDVFLIVIRDAGRYRPDRSSVSAWLCGIARNCARQRFERDRRLQGVESPTDLEACAPLVEPGVLEDLTRSERLGLLRRAVLGLPVRYREVLVLCDLQELSYAEAADALDCAIGTVRSRLHRARAVLAARMAALESAAPPARDRRDSEDEQPADAARRPLGPQRRCTA
jgi:RNA polymerase sigma-70 factor (ECF subfamily)